MKETVDRAAEGLDQIDVLLKLCPKAPQDNEITSPLPVSHMSAMAMATQQDELWGNVQEIVKVFKQLGVQFFVCRVTNKRTNNYV